MDKLKLRQAIVVEGKYDQNTLRQLVDTAIFTTNGFTGMKDPALLRLLREMDGKILFTADAHRACDVAFGYAEAVELACRCGFDTFWRLTEEGFVPAPLHRALT